MTTTIFNVIFDHIPFLITLRDNDNHTLLGNPVLAKLAGFKSSAQLEGLSDFDAPWCSYAECYAKQDHDAFDGLTYRQFEPCMTADGYKVLLIQKIPLKNKFHGVDVVLGIGIEITEGEILSAIHLIESHSPLEQGKVLIVSNQLYLKEKFPDVRLTDKDIECVYYLLRGRSAKVIASYLGCSPKTIEARLEKLKSKFQCTSKQMLIEKLINLGFMTMIPEGILKQRLGYVDKFIEDANVFGLCNKAMA